jgi:hypothetical protein
MNQLTCDNGRGAQNRPRASATLATARVPLAASLQCRSAESWGMPSVRLIKHEVVPGCGSYELRFPDGRPSKFVYFENLAGRRLRPEVVDQAVAERVAKIFARAEQRRLDLGLGG